MLRVPYVARVPDSFARLFVRTFTLFLYTYTFSCSCLLRLTFLFPNVSNSSNYYVHRITVVRSGPNAQATANTFAQRAFPQRSMPRADKSVPPAAHPSFFRQPALRKHAESGSVSPLRREARG